MDFAGIVENLQVFLLIFVRIFVMLQIAPLTSSAALPRVARIGLALFSAVAVVSWVTNYPVPDAGLEFVFLIFMEVIIGAIMGLFLVIIYAAFQLSGQFFSLQMGFSASQVFDPLAQIQIPLLGNFLNLIAMMVFLSVEGFQKLFFIGVRGSFIKVRPWDFVILKDHIPQSLFTMVGDMFTNSLLIALPIMGTLMLASLSMGLLAKASPQMNLLMLGFPINISLSYIIIIMALPFILLFFANIIGYSFEFLADFIGKVRVAA